MSARLAGKVVVVTGGASGIGRAVAGRVVAEGSAVVIAGWRREPGERAAAQLPDDAVNNAGGVTAAAPVSGWVSTPESAFIAGAALAIDGGSTAR